MASVFDDLPIIPHEDIADVGCCGCLMVRVRGGEADILCNECGAVIRTQPSEMLRPPCWRWRGRTQFVAPAARIAESLPPFRDSQPSRRLLCSECGEGVVVNAPVA